MNIKKYITTVVAVLISVCAFAYPAPQDEDPVTPLLQQYTAQIQALQKEFEQKLLPSVKNLATFALQIQTAEQTELSFQQEALLEKHILQLDKALTDMVAPSLKDLDVAAFNEQYKQITQAYGAPTQEFTLQDISELFKGIYLVSALGYFEQTKKLNNDELAVLAEIFFPQEEETQEN